LIKNIFASLKKINYICCMEKVVKKRGWVRDWKFIHVNQHNIKQCNILRKKASDGEITKEQALSEMPHAITVKTNKSSEYGSLIIVRHPDTGEELMRLEHTPFDPYNCGAQIVIKTQMDIEVSDFRPVSLQESS
jgi:hypothetical protein